MTRNDKTGVVNHDPGVETNMKTKAKTTDKKPRIEVKDLKTKKDPKGGTTYGSSSSSR